MLLLCSMAFAQGGPPPAAVGVAPVQRENVQQRRMVTGELRAVQRSQIAAREPGIVEALPVREGQVVEQGELLAELDGDLVAIELREAEAQIASAEALRDERNAELTWRQRDLGLIQSSFERGAANPREMQDAESAAAVAQRRLEQAERQIALQGARAELLRQRLADMAIAAPFRGVVVSRHTEVGQWIGEGDPVVELVSAGAVEAWLNVPQRLLAPADSTAATIAIQVDATGELLQSSTTRIVPLVDQRARTFTMIVRLDDAGAMLVPGMSITGWLPTAERAEQLLVPADAIMRNETGPFVYAARQVSDGGPVQAVPVPIQITFSMGDRVAIGGGGLREGERVVIEGNERLFPMSPITPVQHGGDGAAGASDGRGRGGGERTGTTGAGNTSASGGAAP